MRAIKTQKGFTIVETLIVLAVTSAMFVATSIMVSGQIQRYQFRESSINMEQRIADSINDVRVGYFGLAEGGSASIVPSGQCKAAGDPATGATSLPGASDCVYVGKKVVISSGTDPKMTISSLVSAVDVATLEGKKAAPGNGPNNAFIKDNINTVEVSLPTGLDYSKDATYYVLFDRFGTTVDPLTNKGEGQSVSVYGVDGSSEIAKFSNDPAGGVISVCASNGSRYVSYRFGANGSSTIETKYTQEPAWGC